MFEVEGKARTGRERLLELLGLLGVLEGQSVEVLRASDLELDQRGLLVLLDPGGWKTRMLGQTTSSSRRTSSKRNRRYRLGKRTGGILPAADLDELFRGGLSVRLSREEHL